MKTPTKIDLTSSATLDEIKHQLIENLSPKQLAEFVLGFGDDMTDGLEYWIQLHKELKKTFAENPTLFWNGK